MSISSLISEGEDLFNQATGIFSPIIGADGKILNNSGYVTQGIGYALSSVKSKNWRFDLGYAFEVEGDPKNQFTSFKLQINPQDLQQSETFSISVIPVQTGVVVEHQGFVTKQLIISGTTGMRPMGAVKTGYAEFLRLRNYFRSYAECKKYSEFKDMRLIFRNKKDNEHWYVEPIGPGVALRRVANRPFLYDYTITLMITGRTGEYPKKSGLFGDILDGINLVEDFIDEVSDRIESAASIIHDSADLLNRITRQIAITLTNPVDKVSTVLKAMKYAKTTISALPRSFYQELRRSAIDVRDNFIDLVGYGDSRYNVTYGRTPLPAQKAFIFSDVKTLEALNEVVAVMDKVLSSNIIFSSEAGSGIISGNSSKLEDSIKINSKAVQDTRTGSNQSLSNAFKGALDFNTPKSVKEAIIQNEDTLEKIAYREMGAATDWYQIVLLNNLDPPFISDVPIAGKNTVQYGGRILIPVYGTPEQSNTLQKDDTPITQALSVFEKNLGVDIQITSENDLAINSAAQDLELIAGVPNASQSITIKLGLDKGALLYHPEIGVDMQVGQKTLYTAEEIIDMIETTITQDQRFESVESIQVTREGSTYTLKLKVNLKYSNKPTPLQLLLRS